MSTDLSTSQVRLLRAVRHMALDTVDVATANRLAFRGLLRRIGTSDGTSTASWAITDEGKRALERCQGPPPGPGTT